MTEKIIRVRIPRVGLATGKTQVKVEALNYQGNGCSVAAKRVADLVGHVEDEHLKEEYHLQETIDGTTSAENG